MVLISAKKIRLVWALSEKPTILFILILRYSHHWQLSEFYFQNFIFQRVKMPVHSSLKESDTYDSLYYLAKFVVVSQHLAFDVMRLYSFLSPLYTDTSRTTHKPISQPHARSEICNLEGTQLDASYTPV